MTPQSLAAVRVRIPDCALAVWVDMESSTVLAGDSDLHYPQEHLDALGDCAGVLLSLPAVGGGPLPDDAGLFTATGSYAFLRLPDAKSEALCCLCGPMSDPGTLIGAIRKALVTSGLLWGVRP